MPTVRWKTEVDCSEPSIIARDQILEIIEDGRIASSVEIQFLKSEDCTSEWRQWDDIDVVGVIVDRNSPIVHAGRPHLFSLDPDVKNVALLSGEILKPRDIDVISKCDEMWVTPGKTSARLADSGIPPEKVKLVVPRAHVVPHKDVVGLMPTGRLTFFCHEEWRDIKGVECFVRAWLRNDTLADCQLNLSIRDQDIGTMRSWASILRMEEGRDGDSHGISIIAKRSAPILDTCLAQSDVVVCAHTTDIGWRPYAAKALLLGKFLISSTAGDITKQVSECRWVPAPDLSGVLPTSRERSLKSMTESFENALSEGFDPTGQGAFRIPGADFVEVCRERSAALTSGGM